MIRDAVRPGKNAYFSVRMAVPFEFE